MRIELNGLVTDKPLYLALTDVPPGETPKGAVVVDGLAAEVEAVAQEHGHPGRVCFPDPEVRCRAHGDMQCTWCHQNPADFIAEASCCSTWPAYGMHWDTCPTRIRSAPPEPVSVPDASLRDAMAVAVDGLVSGPEREAVVQNAVGTAEAHIEQLRERVRHALADAEARGLPGDQTVTAVRHALAPPGAADA